MTKRETSHFPTILVFNTTERNKTGVALVVGKKINHPAAKPSGYDQMKDCLIYMFHLEQLGRDEPRRHPRGRANGVFTKNQITKLIELVRAQDLQKLTDQLLALVKIPITEIDAVAVLTGPGSYTGTRMGVAAANTLGWWLEKPIIELAGDSLDTALKTLQNHPVKIVTQATARY